MTVGKRHDLTEDEYAFVEPGMYGKNVAGEWFMRVPAPGFGTGSLRKHEVVEHEDGTITVSPSILCWGHWDETTQSHKQWHGYLERGIWREV
jgi:hypothetical protein